VFAKRPRHDGCEFLKGRGDFIYTIVNSVTDLPDDPQVRANDLRRRLRPSCARQSDAARDAG